MENESLAREIVCGIRWLAHKMNRDAARAGKHFGITVAQSSVVRILALNGPMSSAALAKRIFVTPANITGIVDRLEKKGLAERIRQSNDRRVTLISLTPAGKELGKGLPDPLEHKLIGVMEKMPAEEKQKLAHSIQQVISILGASDTDDMTGPL